MVAGKIKFYACNNGYGHLRRVLRVASELLAQKTDISIEIVCSKDKLNTLYGGGSVLPASGKNKICFSHHNMARVPAYSANTEYEAFQRWFDGFHDAGPDELVVLDNEALLLEKFPTAVLMGSFLWSDVIESMEWNKLMPYVKKERELIRLFGPNMLGLADMAMPGVRNRTRFVPMPWFVDRTEIFQATETERKTILLTMGGSGKEASMLPTVMLDELESDGWEIYTDGGIYRSMNGRYPLFDFSRESFRMVRLVIGRPGIGIMTECAEYGIPIACIYEDLNPEMANNAERAAALGLGIDLIRLNAEMRIAAVRKALSPPLCDEMRRNWLQRSFGGAKASAEWLMIELGRVARLNLETTI
jgi:hypothetical protein